MKRQDVENTITEYLKPVFGFALKRCKSIHDAEDLSQEIVLRAYRALLAKEDIADMGKFIWTVAHNTLSNYYRDAAKSMIGVSIDEVSELIADPDSLIDEDDNAELLHRFQIEIAYLSKLQRRIVIAYYFENHKQADIASELGIPLGTVKWHLFEAKKELKRGMDKMRKASELKFIRSNCTTMASPDQLVQSRRMIFPFRSVTECLLLCAKTQQNTIQRDCRMTWVFPLCMWKLKLNFLKSMVFCRFRRIGT